MTGHCAVDFLLFYASISFGMDLSTTQCGQPEVPENGHVTFQSSSPLILGASVTYKCDVGFTLVGPEKRVCQSGAVWSEHAPVCSINVALYKPTTQSSTLQVDLILHHANYSTDGNFDGVCSSTKSINAYSDGGESSSGANWWAVDLLQVYRIYAVELLVPATSPYPPEGNKSDENNIEIYAYADEEEATEERTLCYRHNGPLESNQLHTFVCQKELYGRHVKIISRMTNPLQLCEVVVLSTSAASESQCGSLPNMDSWGSLEGNCFYGSTEPMPWYSANTHCQMNGATLVTEMNEQLHQFLSAQARHRSGKRTQQYWLGLVLGGNRDWTWITGKPAKNEFWADPKAREVQVTVNAYAAAMARSAGWNWVPGLQNLWYHWICQSSPRVCSSPGIAPNGGVMLSTQMYTIGASSFYYCNHGFTLKGPTSRTCLENGTWSETVPKCLAIDCGKPDIPIGLTVRYINDSTLIGSRVEYHCPIGKKILGVSMRTCQSDSTWSDIAPRCADVDCGLPPEVANGRVFMQDNSTISGSVAEWTCDDGYGLIGPPTRHCAPNGQWVPTQIPYCYDINAVRASVPAEGWQHSQLTTGFVVAAVILLSVILVVLIWMWRRKKTYDGLSMSTLYAAASSHLAAAAAAPSFSGSTSHTEVLYAFPPGSTGYHRVNSPGHKDDGPHYYVPSLLDPIQDSASLRSNSVATLKIHGENKLSSLSVDDLDPGTPRSVSQHAQLPLVFARGIAPSSMAPVFFTSDGTCPPKPILLTPVHDHRQMKRIVNDIHLTLPSRRRLVRDANLNSRAPFAIYNQKAPNLNTRTVRDGAKTVGAAAGRIMTTVRRKISEVNFSLFNTRANTNGEMHGHVTMEPDPVPSTTTPRSHYPTLRISLAEIVQQLNESNAQKLKAALNPIDQLPGSMSPTGSELFSFDEEEEEENGNAETMQRTLDGDRRDGHYSYMQPETSAGMVPSDNVKCKAAPENQESKIYDLPPDSSAIISRNMAKALLKEENIYETPLDAGAESAATRTKRLEEVGIQIVHTYC